MKKLFLLFALVAITASAAAQSLSNEERDAAILAACKYALEHNLSAVEFGEYGSLLYLEIDDPSKYCNSIEWADKYQKKYGLSAGDFIALVKKYRERNGGFIIPKGENTRYATTIHNRSAARLRLKPVNTVAGASLIGVSAASYAISASFISTSKDIKDYRKSMRIAGITCGVGCVIGAIVILSGLHKEYEGIQVADNVVISDYGMGLGVGVRF